MTTNIKVLNDGPHHVKVEVQGRNVKGQFVATEEYYIGPGSFKTLWVGGDKSIQVLEQKTDAAAPTPAPDTAGNSEGLLS